MRVFLFKHLSDYAPYGLQCRMYSLLMDMFYAVAVMVFCMILLSFLGSDSILALVALAIGVLSQVVIYACVISYSFIHLKIHFTKKP